MKSRAPLTAAGQLFAQVEELKPKAAELDRLKRALAEYPARNTRQLQARKVCEGVLALAASGVDLPPALPTPLPAAVTGLRQGNWSHPDGGRIVGWVVEADDSARMGADAFCLPREVEEALATMRDKHRTPDARLAKVVAFLLGEASLEGVWFGEKHPSGQPYWWRNKLRDATRGPVNGR